LLSTRSRKKDSLQEEGTHHDGVGCSALVSLRLLSGQIQNGSVMQLELHSDAPAGTCFLRSKQNSSKTATTGACLRLKEWDNNQEKHCATLQGVDLALGIRYCLLCAPESDCSVRQLQGSRIKSSGA
jgi:hypothetical protein